MVFNVCKRSTFEALDYWFDQLCEHAPENCSKIIVGNKIDLSQEREVPTQEAITYAKQRGLCYLETSAKYGSNIAEAFELLARGIKDKIASAGRSEYLSEYVHAV